MNINTIINHKTFGKGKIISITPRKTKKYYRPKLVEDLNGEYIIDGTYLEEKIELEDLIEIKFENYSKTKLFTETSLKNNLIN